MLVILMELCSGERYKKATTVIMEIYSQAAGNSLSSTTAQTSQQAMTGGRERLGQYRLS